MLGFCVQQKFSFFFLWSLDLLRCLIDQLLHVLQIANIYFDPSLQCGDHCYVGLPFLSKCK